MLGGGNVQRDRLAIASLELRSADFIRRRASVAENLARDIIDAVLCYEKLGREVALIASQLETQQQRRVSIMESAYRTGRGSTTSMLSIWQRTEDLEARQQEQVVLQEQAKQTLDIE